MMYAKKVSGRNMSLTGGMFRFMVLSFFVSNIITVLGSMMDSFTVSNTMEEAAVAAVGFAPQIVAFLRVSPDSEAFGSCVDYLRGTVIGVPAITVMSIFTRGAHIEGNRNLMLLSAAVMVVTNVLSDLVCLYLLHSGVFGITLNTSFSYYAGTAVLVYYYFRKDALVKPVFQGFTFREMLSANNAGLAPGLLSVWYSLTLMVKAELINIGISEFNAETVGLQAYNVTVQVNYFVNALMMSAVAAFGSDGGAVSGQCGARGHTGNGIVAEGLFSGTDIPDDSSGLRKLRPELQPFYYSCHCVLPFECSTCTVRGSIRRDYRGFQTSQRFCGDIRGHFGGKHYRGPHPAGVCISDKQNERRQGSSVDIP